MQFDLFPPPPLDLRADAALAARRPPGLYVGTSSWTFPGWGGLVYRGRPTQAQLVRWGLQEYAQHPLFNTVCIDRGYYAPLSPDELEHTARQLPPGYRCGVKVWQAITDPGSAQYLDVGFFKDSVLAPLDRAFAGHLGPLVFQFPPMAHAPPDFVQRLERFFSRLPPGLMSAVELRTPALLTPHYLEALARHGVAHVLNHWERMPGLAAQLRVPGVLTGPHVVARVLLPQGLGYESAREAFAPFDRLQAPDDGLRAAVSHLWERCAAEQRTLWLFVGNKAEGCAPLTVRGLLERVTGAATCRSPEGMPPAGK